MLSPESAAGYARAFCHGGEFRVSNLTVYGTESRKGRKATIATRNDAFTTDDISEAAYSLGNEFGVLDEICRRIDNAGHQDQIIGQIGVTKRRPFVCVARIRRFEEQCSDVCF